ncbi:MAG: hypothetical protein R3C56_08895 [Pirellulaceae bacterium]
MLQSQESQLVPMPFNVASSDWANSSITYQSAAATEPIRHGLAITFTLTASANRKGTTIVGDARARLRGGIRTDNKRQWVSTAVTKRMVSGRGGMKTA